MNVAAFLKELLLIFALLGLAFAALAGGAHAAAPAAALPRTEITLTRVAVDRWRADYVFAEPVSAIDLGSPVGQYRKQAWRALTPGVELIAADDKESLRSAVPITGLSVEIKAFDEFAENQYVPISRFSDGGCDFYLGFLYGTLMQSGGPRTTEAVLRLQGLGDETVLAPARPRTELDGYAYFGPNKPARMGKVNVIIDPQAPRWLREVIEDTTAKVSQFYEQSFHRTLPDIPLVSIAVVGFDGAPSRMSLKGGVAGGGIAYRLQGRGLVDDHPRKRQHVAAVVAHEMAHLWQASVKRGGIGDNDPWVHEGGAEALMLAALRGTGLLTEAEGNAYAQRLLDECQQLKDDITAHRGLYACGFKRFRGYAMATVRLWRVMMTRSEETGDVYSEAMIQTILNEDTASSKP
jgi:hypothetical protein